MNGAFALTVNTTGATTFGAPVGSGTPLASVTTNAGGATTITGNVTTTGAQTFNDAVTLAAAAATLATANNAVTFATTVDGTGAGAQALTVSAGLAAVSFGNDVGSAIALASVTVTGSGAISVNGNITSVGLQSYSGPMSLGTNAILSTTTNTITIGSTVTGAGHNLSLESGSWATTVTGNLSGVSTLALHTSAGQLGSMTFNGSVAANQLTTQSGAHAIALNGGGTIATGPVTFLNTGSLTIASGFVFTGGMSTSSVSVAAIAGTITAAGTGVLDFSVPVTVTASATLGGTSTGNITLGTATINGGALLTLGAGAATPISTAAIAGSGVPGNVTINTTAAVTIGGVVVTNIGALTVTQSGGTTFSAAVSAASVTLTATTGTITFSGLLTVAGALNSGASPMNLVINAGGSAGTASTLNNTGTLTIPSGFAFTGGVVATAVSAKSFAGTISAAGTGVLNFGGAGLITTTAAATVGGASTGQITLANLIIANGTLLTVGQGVATPISTGSISGAGPGTSDITFNTTGTATVTGIIGGSNHIGTLTNTSPLGTIDVGSSNFTLSTLLVNAGTFKLTGQQPTQSIFAMNLTGTVQYYGGTNGTILLATFFNLTIAGPATFTLGQNITVGDLPAGTGTLLITGGTLDANIPGFTITAAGTWTNLVGNAGFAPHTGTVVFHSTNSPNTFHVNGSTTFFNFSCADPSAIILFQAGATQAIAPSGNFDVAGTAGNVITLNTSLVGTHWLLNVDSTALVTMAYVDVYWSDASFNPIVIPPNVNAGDTPPTIYNDLQWLNVILVTASVSEDTDHDGKIDRIVVTTAATINDNFSGFVATVPGYTVTGYADSGVFTNTFYVYLKPNTTLSTGTVPGWSLTNTTLLDHNTNLKRVFIASPPFTIVDTAPPLLGYTLAVAGTRQVFVQFSEPVYHGPGFVTPISAGDFSYAASGGITGLSAVTKAADGIGISSALLNVGSASGIAADDIVAGTLLHVTGPLIDAAGLSILLPGSGGHRISDIGLGLPGGSLYEPVWARDTTTRPAAAGIGFIDTFDGSKWLRTGDNLTIEGNITSLSSYPPHGATSLVWDINAVSSLETASGLWVPSFTSDLTTFGGFSGLVPTLVPTNPLITNVGSGNPDARAPLAETAVSSNQRNRDFVIPGSDSANKDGATVSFLFSIQQPGALLYTASVPNPATDALWYQHLTVWSFGLHTILAQRGGVSILNNVIDPDKAQTTTLQYTLTVTSAVTVTVFDLSGALVNVLVRGSQDAGTYEVLWNGTNRGGTKVTRGIYFIRIVADGIDEIRKVLVVR